MTLRNGIMVEFISGRIAEQFKVSHNDYRQPQVSYIESSDAKWGAIGIIENSYDGVPETLLIKYKIRIIWNNGRLADMVIGANEQNIKRLSHTDAVEWTKFIETKEEISKKEVRLHGLRILLPYRLCW